MKAHITLSHEARPFAIKDSYGKFYGLFPNGKRHTIGYSSKQIATFQYRRLNNDGTPTPRVRKSKKQRLRERRASIAA